MAPVIAVPTITIDGQYDPFTPAGNGAAYRAKFTGKYEHRVFPVGHNVPQEAPRPSPRPSSTSIISRPLEGSNLMAATEAALTWGLSVCAGS